MRMNGVGAAPTTLRSRAANVAASPPAFRSTIDRVERTAARGGAFRELERVHRVARARCDRAPRQQVLVDDLARDALFVDDEDARAVQRVAELARRFFDALERDGEPERRAAAEAAVEADLSAHQLDDAARDRQSEARAAEAAARRLIGLAERLEQVRRDLRRDPRTGVGDGEPHDARVLALDALDDRAHRDASGRGELHRVSEQVQQHLTQPVGVAEDAPRHVGRDVGREREPFLARRGGEDVGRVLHRDDRGERRAVELHPAGFDLREVQDVVDDRQQRLGRVADGDRVLLRLVGERRLQQQLRHPDDRVDRGADLVAHRREELRLHLGRLDRAVVRRADRLLGALAVRDVADDDARLTELRRVAAAHELDREEVAACVAAGRLDGGRLRGGRDARVIGKDPRDRGRRAARGPRNRRARRRRGSPRRPLRARRPRSARRRRRRRCPAAAARCRERIRESRFVSESSAMTRNVVATRTSIRERYQPTL